MNELEVLNKEIYLDKILKKLGFTEDTIILACEEQAKVFGKVAMYRVQALRNKNEAKSELELLKAETALKFRRKDDKKRSEGYIKDLVTVKTKNAQRKYDRALELDVMAELLCKAFDMRLWSMKIVANVAGMDQAIQKKLQEVAEDIRDRESKIREKYGDSNDDDE